LVTFICRCYGNKILGHTEIKLNKGSVLASINLDDFDSNRRRAKNFAEVSLINKGIHGNEIYLKIDDTEEFGNTIVYRVTGQLTYVNSIAHVKRVKRIAKEHEVTRYL
jgi:MFS superfamily sulfate permease-like transporter